MVLKRSGFGFFVGSRVRVVFRLEIRFVVSGFLGIFVNFFYGDKLGLFFVIMEFRKLEKNSILKCKGRGKNKGRGS